MSERSKRARGAGDGRGFQKMSIPSRAFDAWFVLVGAKRRDIDAVGNRLAPESNITNGILTDVGISKDAHESGIPARAPQVKDALFQAAGRTVAKACGSSEQYEQIGTAPFDRLQNRKWIDQSAVKALSAIDCNQTVVQERHRGAGLQQRQERRLTGLRVAQERFAGTRIGDRNEEL